MAGGHPGSTPPRPHEDAANRFVTEREGDSRALFERLKRKTYVLADGPQAGDTIEYWTPVIDVEAVTDVNLDADNDEVSIFGAVGGGAGARIIVDVDAAGRIRTNVEDGQDIALGATTDASILAGAAGSVSSKLRAISEDLGDTTDGTIGAGAAGTLAAKTRSISRDIGQTTDAEVAAGASGSLNAKFRQATGNLGDEADIAVEGDTAGTASAKLRGTNKSIGSTADLAVLGDAAGSLSAKIRGLARIFNDVWDDTTDALRAKLRVGTADVSTTNPVPVAGTAATTAPPATNPVLVAGWDGVNTQTLFTDVSGRIRNTVADGQDFAQGSLADVAVQGDTAGSISAKLRGLNKVTGAESDAEVAAGATGTISGKLRGISVDIGDTTDGAAGSGNAGSVSAKLRGISRDIGGTGELAVEGDASGAISGKLRGTNKVLGTTADVAVLGDTAGSLSAKLRGLNFIFNDAHDDIANALRVTQEVHDEFNANANIQVGNVDVGAANPVPIDWAGDDADLDSGAGTDSHPVIAIGLPGAGGHVVGGTDTNPLSVAQNSRGELFANATLQIAGTDSPGGAGVSNAQTPRFTLATDDAVNVSLDAIELDADAIRLAVEIIDDWDEANRAAVNLIAGQVGVQGGSGAVTALSQRVVLATDVGLPAGTNNIGDVDVLTEPATAADASVGLPATTKVVSGYDGTNVQAIKTDASGELQVDVLSSTLPTGAATLAEQQTQTTALQLIDNIVESGRAATNPISGQVGVQGAAGAATALTQRVALATDANAVQQGAGNAANPWASQGAVAHDGVDSGNPLKVGYKALSHGANPAAVAANDRTDAFANRHGVPWVIGGHPNVISREYHTTALRTDDDIVLVAAGTKIVVTKIAASLDEACTVGVNVRVGFGAATLPAVVDGGTVDGIILDHPGLVPGGGTRDGDGSGILGVGADGEDLRITNSVPTGGSLRVIVSYYTIES